MRTAHCTRLALEPAFAIISREPGLGGRRTGFTVVELLAVVAVLGLAACLLATAMARTTPKPKAFLCLNNLRQLTAGLAMYAQDHKELFPPNPDDGNTISGHNWCQGIAGQGDGNEYDPETLRKCLLSPYIGRQIDVFSCPADPRPSGRANGASSGPQYLGKLIRPARSISMSGAVGTACNGFKGSFTTHQGTPIYPVDGPWLDNQHSHRSGQPWRTYGKATDIVAPFPSQLWVLLDENPVGMNDANFGFGMNTAQWIDFPGIAHEMAGTFGFADGHAEVHRWQDSRTRITTEMITAAPGSVDWLWLSQRTSARAQ